MPPRWCIALRSTMRCPGWRVCTRRRRIVSSFARACSGTCEIWGAADGPGLVGIIAFREGWIDQLYVLPTAQRRGIGTDLLDVAKSKFACLQLWTFQRNVQARRFYESRGFVLVEETDGAGNEEREPDARYLWSRGAHARR